MNKSRVLIAMAVVVVDGLLAMVSLQLFIFFSVAALWFGVVIGIQSAKRRRKQRPFLQIAQSLADIRRVDYFRRVSAPQLETWLLAAFTARGFTTMGDPVLGRSHDQGCVWRSGKKAALHIQQERPLNEGDLVRIWTLRNECKADSVFIFSPFLTASKSHNPRLEILAGQEFLSWMSVLDGVRPLNVGVPAADKCSCGAPLEERVSHAGEALLICLRYPDCDEAPQPDFGKAVSGATVS
jgi:hypothetical protein